MKIRLFICLIVGLFTNWAWAVELNLSTDAVLHNLDTGEKTTYKANQKINYSERVPLMIEASGRIPVLLVPLKSETGIVNIDAPTAGEVFRDEKELRIDQELSTVILEISTIHRYIAERKFSSAKEKIANLTARYPNVKFLEFINASVSFLSGDRERAVSSVEEGLKHHPEYEQGVELKKKLTGEKSE